MRTLCGHSRYIEKVGNEYRFKSHLRGIFPSWLSLDPNVVTLPETIAAAGTISKLGSFNVPQYGKQYNTPFVGKYLMFADSGVAQGTAAANFRLKLEDQGSGRQYTNQPIHVRNFFGTAQNPGKLRERLIVPPEGLVTIQPSKISGAATTYWPYIHGRRFFTEGGNNPAFIRQINERFRYTSPYFLTTNTVPVLTALQTLSFTVKITQGHFQAFALSAIATGSFQFSISEVETRRTLMNGAITLSNGIGNAQFPDILDFPYLVEKGAQLKFTLTDLSNAGNTIELCLQGRSLINVPLKHVAEMDKDTYVPYEDEEEDL